MLGTTILRVVSRSVLTLGCLCLLAQVATAAPATCDLNGDGAVDRRDLDVLTAALNSPASAPGDRRDVNADGRITALDVRQCVLRCTTARCAPALPYEVAAATVGAGGGSVQLTDGTSLRIPPGALAAPVTITVREIPLPVGSTLPPSASLAGKMLSLEPDGLQFNLPVTLTLPTNVELLPPSFERADALVMTRLPNGRFSIVGNGDADAESHMQQIDAAGGTVTARLRHFSLYGAIFAHSVGAFVAEVVNIPNLPGSTLSIRRPLGPAPGFRQTKPVSHNCAAGTAQVALPTRADTDILAILVHSTNGGPDHTFSGELGWGADDCNQSFAHYYIDRGGDIFQVAADQSVVNHTANGTYTNGNAIGIELFNNIGEPYDGMQVNALIRLLDYLTLRYNIPRPQRDASTGLPTRDATLDRVITHSENLLAKCPAIARRCDPIGNFQSSGTRTFIDAAGNLAEEAIPDGNAAAPSLLDMVVDALSVLDRTRKHTGVINAAGGDSIGQAVGGVGGAVTVQEAAALVPVYPGPLRANHRQLVVAPNTTVTLPLPQPASASFSDVMIAGRLVVSQLQFINVSGSFYLAPSGSIVVRDGANGGPLSLSARGPAILQGLVDTRGEDAPSTVATQAGGNGGNVTVSINRDHNFLLPAIITRGGDTDVALVGGNGGAVSVSLFSGNLFVGGGTGVRANLGATPNPASRSDFAINDADFTATFTAADSVFPRYSGDKLPPPPPFNLGTIGYSRPIANQRTPLLKSSAQSGFSGGILTSGGMGGAGVNGFQRGSGGTGGSGGPITINAASALGLTFRDVDLITGGDAHSTVSLIFVDPNAGLEIAYRAPTGSLGGKAPAVSGIANRGGDGGAGGAAGSITFNATLAPAASFFTLLPRIIGYTSPVLGLISPRAIDNPLDTTRFSIGVTKLVSDANGRPLYRLRLDDQNNALGGSGGIPGGRSQQGNFPGNFGVLGAGGAISTGLPH